MSESLVTRVKEGDIRALGRVITEVENGTEAGLDYLKELYPEGSGKIVIGLTGPPGSGKSTLVDAMTRAYRKQDKKVGIVAVDPTSPFSGGALLGDRIRMQGHFTDPGVFIRSMATRGSTGGLALSTIDVVDVICAAGYDVVLVETIGVGQDEVDVIRAVDTVVVVAVPGLGDDIQALKAGIMEISDIFVVNKADLPGVDRTLLELKSMLSLSPEREWGPPILPMVALKDEGLEELLKSIDEHRAFLTANEEGMDRFLKKAEFRVERALSTRFLSRLRGDLVKKERWTDSIASVAVRKQDPYTVSEMFLKEIL